MADETGNSPLEQLILLLQRHGVEFILIGGQAEALHGSPRVTYDIDLCYRRSPENLERLAGALREMKVTLRNAPPDLPFIIDARSLALGCNYTFDTPFDAVDFLGYVEPIGGYDDLIQNAEHYPIGDRKLAVISLDDLIRVKEHIQRPKDRESLFQLRAIKDVRKEHGRKED